MMSDVCCLYTRFPPPFSHPATVSARIFSLPGVTVDKSKAKIQIPETEAEAGGCQNYPQENPPRTGRVQCY